jgi:hypothetical protein
MPAKIDRLGRATEWRTRYILLKNTEKSEKAKMEADQYFNQLPENEKKRCVIASQKIAEKILEMCKGKEIVDVNVVGEKSKKMKTDADLIVYFSDGSNKSFSLKVTSTAKNVNVRNATLNSLCRSFTGKDFDNFLSPEDKKWYENMGEMYSQGKIESKILGEWAAKKFAEILKNTLNSKTRKFLDVLFSEIRYTTKTTSILIIVVVDKKGNFKGYVTKFDDLFKKIEQAPNKLDIQPNGIRVSIVFEQKELLGIDLYMQSGSRNYKGKKLRCAIRVNFEIEEK